MPATAGTVAQYEHLVYKYRGLLDEGRMSDLLTELRDLVPMGRYSGPKGVFIATDIRPKDRSERVEDVYVAFYPLGGGEEEKMPVINCLEFYTFLVPELM